MVAAHSSSQLHLHSLDSFLVLPSTGDTSAGGARAGGDGAGEPGAGGTGAGGARAGVTGVGDPGAGVAVVGGTGAGGPGAGGTVQRRPFFVPPPPRSLPPPGSPESRPALPIRAICTGRCVPRPRPPPVPDTHIMALSPSSVPIRVPLLPPPASSLPAAPDPESELARAASPTVPRLLANVVTNPSFESNAASALVAELVDFVAVRRLDYATNLVAESESDCPPSVGGECALGTDVLEDSLRRPVYGLRQAPREWHDILRTTLVALGFAPSTADPSLFLRTDTTLPPFYVLVYVNELVFATADTETLALVNSELQKRHTCTDLGDLRSYLGLQITRDRARRTIALTQTHMVHQVHQRSGFRYSSAYRSLALSSTYACGHLFVLKICGDFVIHPELALLFLTALWQPTRCPPCSPHAALLQPARCPFCWPHQPRAALPCPAHFPRACAPPYLYAALLVARHPALPAMTSLSVLTFDHKGHPIQFDTCLNDLLLYLPSDSRVSVSLFDHTSGASLAHPAIADSATRSQWLTRDAAARLAVCNHLPLAERAHFGQHKTAKALYDGVVARYFSPATAALGRLILPYLFPELSAIATVEDLVSHFRTSDARYRFALPTKFLDKWSQDQ
ncbi:unnamed protein product [Closterium sp. NIES-53]